MSHTPVHIEIPREVSKRRKIYDTLLARIQNESLPVGSRLLPTIKLAEEWRVAPATAQAALNDLSRDGWLVRHPRQGTFVSTPIQNLNGSVNRTIGIVLPPRQDIDTSGSRLEVFETLQGLTIGAKEVGWHVRIETIPSNPNAESEKHAMEAIRLTSAAAFMGSVQYCRLIERLAADGHSVVTMLEDDPGYGHVVLYDRSAAVRLGAQHLIDRGYRRIGFFGKAGDIKFEYFKTVLAENGIAPDQGSIGEYPSLKGVESAARKFLRSNPGVDAVFAGNYQAALAIVREIRYAGRRVPQDIAVMAYGIESDGGTMALSYVRVPYWECGVEAMKLIAQNCTPSSHRQVLTIQPEIILREST